MTSVNNTKNSISAYSGQIAEAQAQADALGNQIAEQDKNIAALKKQLQEEIAKSRLAAKSAWRDISEVSFAEGDRYLLANLIYCEAGNQPYAGQVAVGAVVINRVLSSVYPNTVSGVIYQYKQFAPVLDGHLAIALANDSATAACYKAADEAMSGYTNVGRCVYFRTPIEGYQGSTFKQLHLNKKMCADYLLYVINLHRKALRENKIGSAIPHLNKKLFKAIEVPVPPYNEQVRIVAAINSALNRLDAIMENL